jgi:hypothetical protein
MKLGDPSYYLAALAGFLALLSALLQDYAAVVVCKVYATEVLAMSATLPTTLAKYTTHKDLANR